MGQFSPRRSQFRAFFAPGFALQSDISTPISLAGLTQSFQLVSPQGIEIARTLDDIYECSGQFRVDQQTITRMVRWTFEADCNAAIAGWALAGAMGVAAAPSGGSSNLTMLGISQFELPYTTVLLQYQSANPTDPGLVLNGLAVNRVTITGRGKERLKIAIEIVARADFPAPGSFTPPACTPVIPLRMTDGILTVNSVDRLQGFQTSDPHNVSHSFVFDYNNNILVNDNPFTLAQKDAQRFERSDRVAISAQWLVEGYVGDTLFSTAFTDPRTFWPFVFRIGTAGAGVTITATKAMVLCDDRAQAYEGEAGRACLNMRLDPTLNGSTLPVSVNVVSAQGFLGN